MIKYFFPWIIALFFSNVYSQNLPGTKLKIKKFHGDIVLDGVLDEQAWKDADVADNWYQNFPVDSLPSPFQTEARMTFNDEFLYVSFVCFDDDIARALWEVIGTSQNPFIHQLSLNNQR